MVSPIYEFVPRIIVGRMCYTHYPIRPISRQETEGLLHHPSMRRTIILRISQSSREENAQAYYVLSYIPIHEIYPVHVIVTRDDHEDCQGDIRLVVPRPIAEHQLLILPHHAAFQDTRQEFFPRLDAPFVRPSQLAQLAQAQPAQPAQAQPAQPAQAQPAQEEPPNALQVPEVSLLPPS